MNYVNSKHIGPSIHLITQKEPNLNKLNRQNHPNILPDPFIKSFETILVNSSQNNFLRALSVQLSGNKNDWLPFLSTQPNDSHSKLAKLTKEIPRNFMKLIE